jgi:prolyl 4-hydroxylase
MPLPQVHRPRIALEEQHSPLRAAIGAQVGQKLGTTPGVTRLAAQGAQIFTMDGFLNEGECARLIAMINAGCQPSSLFQSALYRDYRTSSSCNMDRNDPFLATIEQKICTLTGIDPRHGETSQGQRYQVAQKYGSHHDFFYIDQPYWEKQSRHGGQRSWTAMAYLNEPAAGGTTSFPSLNLSIAPRTGRLVLWNNMDARGAPNALTLHSGDPVTSGDKYVLTKWFREGPWI